ncbi:DUF6890 family protein [Pseudodesulfovibrio sediminis]|uniref:Uncharacterized protein n=1 Tax=Pseudodesulfovibrio sediminis TaxID=2810563 RepID=A0ABM8I3I9_9BACT|nr:hypothetical protein [Pseudodesulfovibrio sediminis]BCS89964.1 hypothetical protein PSDVSF_32060 [Pseudodesulfovibrio sediminis]
MAQLLALHQKWMPGQETSTESMGTALFLEKEYWDKMSIAITNGIAKAMKG